MYFLMMWKAENCLIFSIFGRKRALWKKLGKARVCHIVCYHLISAFKKIPNFHSFLSIGTVLSPPPLITWPLCSAVGVRKWLYFESYAEKVYWEKRTKLDPVTLLSSNSSNNIDSNSHWWIGNKTYGLVSRILKS